MDIKSNKYLFSYIGDNIIKESHLKSIFPVYYTFSQRDDIYQGYIEFEEPMPLSVLQKFKDSIIWIPYSGYRDNAVKKIEGDHTTFISPLIESAKLRRNSMFSIITSLSPYISNLLIEKCKIDDKHHSIISASIKSAFDSLRENDEITIDVLIAAISSSVLKIFLEISKSDFNKNFSPFSSTSETKKTEVPSGDAKTPEVRRLSKTRQEKKEEVPIFASPEENRAAYGTVVLPKRTCTEYPCQGLGNDEKCSEESDFEDPKTLNAILSNKEVLKSTIDKLIDGFVDPTTASSFFDQLSKALNSKRI